MSAEKLITDHIDIWTSAVQAKSASGRGSSKKRELYGIKKLRELILELAVRGKLVPQDPTDEPASVLLERIAAEKAQLVKEKKIKKPKALPNLSSENLPTLPDGWAWAHVQDITKYVQRGKGPKYADNGSVRVVSQKCVQNSGFDIEPARYVEDQSLESYQEERYLQEKDLLWNSTGTGTVGRVNVLPVVDSKSLVADSHVTVLRPLLMSSRYIWCFLMSPGVQARINPDHEFSLVSGSTKQVELNTSSVVSLPVSVAPLNEQCRIVAKVDELMALCDQLEQQTEASLDAHQVLVETLLATLTNSQDANELMVNWARISEHFDTLFTTEQSIDQLKQTILQLAVMGKLVPQDPNDEPASDLINRLENSRDSWLKTEASSGNTEAKTMLRKLKKLTTPKPPFTLPESWTCVHLIQMSRLLVDCHNKTAPYVNDGIPIIRTTNIRDRQFLTTDLKFVNQDTYDYWSRRCPPEPGDIIFTREAPMGEALVIPEGAKWCLGQRTMLVRPMHEYVSNMYLLLALTEPNLLQRASEHAVGLTVKHLRVGDVENLNLPLPPLNEQLHIVARVEELFRLCETLKKRLRDNQQTQLQLTDAIVELAL